MVDYQKMYCILCRAVDGVIDELRKIPQAGPCAERLQEALLQAEECYLEAEE